MMALENHDADTFDALLKLGANPNSQGKDDKLNTALMQAVHQALASRKFDQKKTLAPIQALLDAKADPNIANKRPGWTPLRYAVEQQDYDLARLLRTYGADPDLADKKGVSPFLVAVRKNYTDFIQLLGTPLSNQ